MCAACEPPVVLVNASGGLLEAGNITHCWGPPEGLVVTANQAFNLELGIIDPQGGGDGVCA